MSAVHNDWCAECDNDEWNCVCDDGFDDDWDCTHCGGEGICMDGSDPLWDCDDMPHNCHACGGSGKRSDQRIF